MTWKEVTTVKNENRHEIKLSGSEISKRIEDDGLDNAIFELTGLNLLNISDTTLSSIPENIIKLSNLQTLLLYGNKIETFSESISSLSKLKVLDLSRNLLSSIPESINLLKDLTNINLSSNNLESLPKLNDLPNLITFYASNNKLAAFPDIESANLPHLSDLKLNGNDITEIPSCIDKSLPALKNFDIGDNQIKQVPGEIAQITKLKEINLKGNKLSDKRLMKLVDQCRTKQVVDYVREHCKVATNQSGGGKKGKKNQKKSEEAQEENIENLSHSLTILHVEDNVPNVKIREDLLANSRPHILCCIIKNLNFDEELFKKFIQLQTKLHDTICDKRNQATIATHDFDKIPQGREEDTSMSPFMATLKLKCDLLYTAKPASKLKLVPLMRSKEYTGEELFQQLRLEAENLRKEKKRNVYSGIHKFLYLLEGKDHFACLMDSSKRVISFPPITNSDTTKMSHTSKNMFLEVTSQASLGICKTVMDKVIQEFLLLGIGTKDEDNFHSLTIQQVKIVDLEGNLKAVYPSRTDCNYEGDAIKIIRPKK